MNSVNNAVTQPISKRKYMANCIWHIQSAECRPSRRWERDEAIAEAILIAAESGVDHAHDHLVNLSKQAKDGKYAEAK